MRRPKQAKMFTTGTPKTIRRFPEMKLALVVIALMLWLIQTFLPVLPGSPEVILSLWLLAVVGFKLAICFWSRYDGREREMRPGILFYLAVFIFGSPALIYYFFKSRGPEVGMIALTTAFFLWIVWLCLFAMLTEQWVR